MLGYISHALPHPFSPGLMGTSGTCYYIGSSEYASETRVVAEQHPKFDVLHPEPVRSAEYLDYHHRWTEMFHKLSPLD